MCFLLALISATLQIWTWFCSQKFAGESTACLKQSMLTFVRYPMGFAPLCAASSKAGPTRPSYRSIGIKTIAPLRVAQSNKKARHKTGLFTNISG